MGDPILLLYHDASIRSSHTIKNAALIIPMVISIGPIISFTVVKYVLSESLNLFPV